ncbi:hypothetical protein FACS189444_7090 [Spirochaetia bacterium]|nr:hypothetical protein FACS189444_7090 [Spirochaetia bacterium]
MRTVAVDHNIPLMKKQGRQASNKCDGFLYVTTAIDEIICFVELKTGDGQGNWVNDAVTQLRDTIAFRDFLIQNIFIRWHTVISG